MTPRFEAALPKRPLQREEIGPYLFQQLHLVEPLPVELAPVSKLTEGTAFFPGGAGLWLEDPWNQFPDIMVVAQDFATLDEHTAMLDKGKKDIQTSTWHELRRVAARAQLDPRRCFFTNALMGLRASGPSEGPNPGYHEQNPDFMRRSHEFFVYQVQLLRPRLIIVLGLRAAAVMGACAPQVAHWIGADQKSIDSGGYALIRDVRLGDVLTHVVQLTHPARRHLNVPRRRYRGHTGDAAEMALLLDAFRLLDHAA